MTWTASGADYTSLRYDEVIWDYRKIYDKLKTPRPISVIINIIRSNYWSYEEETGQYIRKIMNNEESVFLVHGFCRDIKMYVLYGDLVVGRRRCVRNAVLRRRGNGAAPPRGRLRGEESSASFCLCGAASAPGHRSAASASHRYQTYFSHRKASYLVN